MLLVTTFIPFHRGSILDPLSTHLGIVCVFNGRQKIRAFGAMFIRTSTIGLSTLAGLWVLWNTLILVLHGVTISLGVLRLDSSMLADLFHRLCSAVHLCFNKLEAVAPCLDTCGKVLAF